MNNSDYLFSTKSNMRSDSGVGKSGRSAFRMNGFGLSPKSGFSSFEPSVKVHTPKDKSIETKFTPKNKSELSNYSRNDSKTDFYGSGALDFTDFAFGEKMPSGSDFWESNDAHEGELAKQIFLPKPDYLTKQNFEPESIGVSDLPYFRFADENIAGSNIAGREGQNDQSECQAKGDTVQTQEILLAIFLIMILSRESSDLLLLLSVLYIFI